MHNKHFWGVMIALIVVATLSCGQPGGAAASANVAAPTAGGRVIRYNRSGEYLGEWALGGHPAAIAVGPGGEVYVNINNSHRVVKYSATGEYLTEWRVEAGEPGALAVGSGGEVYVNINNSQRVVKYGADGAYLNDWDAPGVIAGIAVAPGGEVYVNINNSHRVVKYSANGVYLAEWEVPGVIETNGIAVGPGGEVYVTINNSHRVVKYSADGAYLSEWNVPGIIETNGIVVGPSGNVYVTINNSHRVVQYSAGGEQLATWTVAGGRPSGLAVGIATGRVGRHLHVGEVLYVTVSRNQPPHMPLNPTPAHQATDTRWISLFGAMPVQPSSADAGNVQSMPGGPPAILRAGQNVNLHRTPPPVQALGQQRIQTATIQVVYLAAGATDFFGTTCLTWPAEAQAAFSYAASLWETLISSSVPIVIHACWANLPGGMLGYGGADNYYQGFTGAPAANTWYASALANALHGSDLNTTRPDMHLAYSQNFPWYYGTDGNPSGAQYDLVSVVLHEIAHGLGFSGSMRRDDGIVNPSQGNPQECDGVAGHGCWGGGTPYPIAYDRFAEDGGGNALINTGIYPNPSSALGTALTGGNVWFDGTHANAANGGNRVKLYAPATWQSGSSYAHLDEIFNGTQNALMTYSLDYGEANHNPGPIAMGILKDVGWTTGAPPQTGQDIIRNGGFDYDKAGWVTNAGTHVGNGYGKDGVGYGMQIWPEYSNNYYGFMWQELYLPTQTTAAALSLDYQFVPQAGAALGYFTARIVTWSGTIATPVYITTANYPGPTWQSTGALTLNAGQLAALNAAHAAGQRVYVLIDLYAQSLFVNVDNVVLNVTGSKATPTWAGSIAYIGLDNDGYAKTVNRINPDGSSPQTLWTHPQSGITNKIRDVAWKPDASELAFGSNHETLYSAFHSDGYGIRPDGSSLRRITNPPSRAALLGGGYPVGTVTGKVRNDYGSLVSLLLYIQGAQEAVSVPAYSLFSEVNFSVPNVAVLGGLQYVVFTWGAGSDVNCKYYAAAVVAPLAGQTVDVGTLSFNPATCSTYESEGITWKRDGAELAVDVITPRRFQASGQAIGSELFSGPSTANLPAWSPVNDQVLYHYFSFDVGTRGIYLTTAGGGTGARLVNDEGAVWVGMAWLPDGSGFVYTLDHKMYLYNLATNTSTLIADFYNEFISNPSVSPDGRYVVFEWQTGTANLHDLWILDRLNPTERWRLTTNGKGMNPDWSRQNPAPPPTCTTPLTGVSLSGPTTGQTGQDLTYTVSPQPGNATTPITYIWSTDGLIGGQGTTQATYRWNSAGNKTVQVSGRNCGGQDRTASQTVSITSACPIPLNGVTISGQNTGYTNVTYQFTALLDPTDATTPINYVWSNDGLLSGQGTNQASYRWTTIGSHTISLTASNCGGSRNDDHVITLAEQPNCPTPLTGVSLSGPLQGDKNADQTFTASVQPCNATTPIAYVWSGNGLIGGQGTSQATYRWGQAGTYIVSLSVSNCGGSANTSRSIEIGKTYIYLPLVLRNRN